MSLRLIKKYEHQVPRYTSYPTVPYWEDNLSVSQWKVIVRDQLRKANNTGGISLYIHLPYCESLCTYCGCNTRITVNHAVEKPYIEAVLREWNLWLEQSDAKPLISEIHLGGGTPTFFSPENLTHLIESIKSSAILSEDATLSFEAHPNYTSYEHLKSLYDLGFKRVSFGIQDFDPIVQEIINRVQTFETVKTCTELAREIGYESINFDLVYGLPLQTKKSIIDTIEKVFELKPDRIAFYSYAHVPWIKPGQRKFTEQHLPSIFEKIELFKLGKDMLMQHGYKLIGMDHFSLEKDELYTSFTEKKLHRNFMGYTTKNSSLLIGLGVSSISDATDAYAQNHKTIEQYFLSISKGELPFSKGHHLTREDVIIRKHIQNIMCNLQTSWGNLCTYFDAFEEVEERLKELEKDKLIQLFDDYLVVTEIGRDFLRNVALAFDVRFWRNAPLSNVFSKAI
jgi:oxygen-independent coproporphyrinogen-3 oxidase